MMHSYKLCLYALSVSIIQIVQTVKDQLRLVYMYVHVFASSFQFILLLCASRVNKEEEELPTSIVSTV